MRSLEQRTILEEAAAIRREEKQERKASKPKPPPRPKLPRNTAKPKHGRERDFGFLTWLHEDIPCIACLIEGEPANPGPIEAAHQKHTDQKGAAYGRRPSDGGATCPLCQWHHTGAPNCCDPVQVKFWDRLGVNVGDFCRALFDAFKSSQPGEPVVRRFASTPERTA